jgi:hypothetical protein
MNDTSIRQGATPPGSVTGCTPQQQATAVRTVCGNAHDAADARLLLDMLGLGAGQGRGE